MEAIVGGVIGVLAGIILIVALVILGMFNTLFGPCGNMHIQWNPSIRTPLK